MSGQHFRKLSESVVFKKNLQRLLLIVIAASVLLAATAASFAQSKGSTRKRSPGQSPARAPRKTPAEPPMSAQAQAQFSQLSKQADEAREAGRLDEAVTLYNNALRLKPTWAEGWWYLGSIFYDRDRYVEGREALRNLLALQPKNGPAWALIGLCEFQLKNYETALADIQNSRIMGLGGNKALINVARYHAAIIMTRMEQFELGYEVLRDFAREGNQSMSVIEALGINALRLPFLPSEVTPDKREMILLAGRAFYHMAARQVADTERAFQELVSRYPGTPNVHYAHGVFLLIDTPDQAIEAFKRELKISPTHIPALLQIAFEYIKRNEFESAKPFAEQAVQIAPNLFATHNALGRVLLELGKVDEAIKQLEIGVNLAPDSPEMYFALAKAYARAGRKEDAAKARTQFMTLDKQKRTQRDGSQSVGGIEAKPAEKNPPQ
jgi:tetratricopeptide (TPR) repeat protein